MKIKSVETESSSVVNKDTISSDRVRTLERELLKERKITEGTGKKADYW